eukprot:TRINITY_DN4713_c0_g1_i1.p2 TRINITY_DN4713_c0_g1~~TRINITY_DN4713_c0_g1_i1.p2  ORF type:complete len:105 (-),score=16.13 TRINITY_DN4713_c0_g1_i1:487-801(-)
MGDQTNHYLYGFYLTYCLTSETDSGTNLPAIRRCYQRSFPLANRICRDELQEMIEACGYDDRLQYECRRTWRVVQRCMKAQSYWPDLNNHPPVREEKLKPPADE